jgi:hypothetical protein
MNWSHRRCGTSSGGRARSKRAKPSAHARGTPASNSTMGARSAYCYVLAERFDTVSQEPFGVLHKFFIG